MQGYMFTDGKSSMAQRWARAITRLHKELLGQDPAERALHVRALRQGMQRSGVLGAASQWADQLQALLVALTADGASSASASSSILAFLPGFAVAEPILVDTQTTDTNEVEQDPCLYEELRQREIRELRADAEAYGQWEQEQVRNAMRPVEGPSSKRRCVMSIEAATGSEDTPQIVRTLSVDIPVDGEPVVLTLRVRELSENGEQRGACNARETGVPAVADGGGQGREGPPPATRPTQLDAMEFDEYEKVYRLWREGKVDLAEVARDYGNDVADMVQAQHAIVGLQDGGEEVEPLPSPQPLDTRERSGMVKEGGPRPPFGFFENMYGQWKQGMRTDKNVAAAFGAEWFVLFQMWKTWGLDAIYEQLEDVVDMGRAPPRRATPLVVPSEGTGHFKVPFSVIRQVYNRWRQDLLRDATVEWDVTELLEINTSPEGNASLEELLEPPSGWEQEQIREGGPGEAKDADFAYWPLNVGPKPGGSEDEPYGILTNDWQPRWADLRLQALRKLGHGPLLPLPRRSLPMARRPLQLTPRLRAATFDGFSPSPPAKGSPNLAYPFSPGSVATATPSCYGDVDEVPALAPYPWCAPLPGPLVPWPGTARKPAEVPEARYLWKVLPGFDALPGQDAMSVRCSDAEATLGLSIGFKIMELSNVSEVVGFDQTVLYIPEEVRLCATWVELEPVSPKAQVPSRPKDDMGGIQDRIVLPLDNDGHPEAAIEACQRACLERGSSGYELGADGSEARLVPQSEDGFLLQDFPVFPEGVKEEALRSQWKEGRLRFCSDSCPLPRLHLLQLTAVSIGLEVFRDMDAFPGSDARVQKDPGLARCRQICLTDGFGVQEGFAGFAIKDGVARFRSAKGAVLRTRLVPSLGGVFYILTVEKAAARRPLLVKAEDAEHLSFGPIDDRSSAVGVSQVAKQRLRLRLSVDAKTNTLISGKRLATVALRDVLYLSIYAYDDMNLLVNQVADYVSLQFMKDI
eukprot:s1301_g1.t1